MFSTTLLSLEQRLCSTLTVQCHSWLIIRIKSNQTITPHWLEITMGDRQLCCSVAVQKYLCIPENDPLPVLFSPSSSLPVLLLFSFPLFSFSPLLLHSLLAPFHFLLFSNTTQPLIALSLDVIPYPWRGCLSRILPCRCGEGSAERGSVAQGYQVCE